jgi:cytochrome c oxidase subunit 4
VTSEIRRSLVVLAALLVLTMLTLASSSLSLPSSVTIVLGLAIAAAKGALVALFFMHLSSERALVYVALSFTAVFALALFALTLWSEADHVAGTEFTHPFR